MGSDVNLSAYTGSPLVQNKTTGDYSITPSPFVLYQGLIAWQHTDYGGPLADAFLYGSLNNIKILPDGNYQVPSDVFNFDTKSVFTNGRDAMTAIQWIAVAGGAPKDNRFNTIFIGPITPPIKKP
jgi:hypothetical protein